MPADCALGRDCFVQQFPDMDPGPDAVDPFCGSATYDGHDGTDLRILSLADVARGVPVIAMADGKVLRLRDGEPDRLVLNDDDRKAVASKECGNGLVIDHGDGLEVQYCHLKQGSISVSAGAIVKRGDHVGEIGASGLAQFPHVHVTVRKNGRKIDPSTGNAIGAGCKPDPTSAGALFAAADGNALDTATRRSSPWAWRMGRSIIPVWSCRALLPRQQAPRRRLSDGCG